MSMLAGLCTTKVAALCLAASLWLAGPGTAALAATAAPPPAATPTETLSRQEAARFLTQATFGPTEESVRHLQQLGIRRWLDEQFAMPSSVKHMVLGDNGLPIKPEFFHSFWRHALTGPDQLRQRVAFALSEIFVVSGQATCINNAWHGVADYHDMLLAKSFGPYKSLLHSVTLHPIMGCFLSHLRNQKEDLRSGRVPDENFAREVMQLFSIGLYELNKDGSLKLDANGQAIETYTAKDVSGLAKVFTGWSWDCPGDRSDTCFKFRGGAPVKQGPDPWVLPMVAYPAHHSVSAKEFLGVTIAAQTTPDPEGDLETAIKRLASHPNVGPFIGRQLIQRLVTSNPSPAYVQRVAQAFDTHGGSLKATVEAILLDHEARHPQPDSLAAQGKVKEPILRLSALLRAFNASSASGEFRIGSTSSVVNGLGQSPYDASSVFNFFRPGHVAPASASARRGMVAPELQLAHESSVAGYANYMREVIWAGAGEHVAHTKHTVIHPADVKVDYQLDDTKGWLLPIAPPQALVQRIDEQLLFGSMGPELKQTLVDMLKAMDAGRGTPEGPAQQILHARARWWSALLVTVVSPEFCVQR